MGAPSPDSLWLGNDSFDVSPDPSRSDVFQISTTGDILGTLVGTSATGVAFDGASLWLSAPRFGGGPTQMTRRTADGATVLDTFNPPAFSESTEDLAFDSNRQRLWRIDHLNNLPTDTDPDPTHHSGVLVAIDLGGALVGGPVFPKLLPFITIPTSTDPAIDPANLNASTFGGAYGITYDQHEDKLYISFSQRDPLNDTTGRVIVVDPDTGDHVGDLFNSPNFATGGLAFNPSTSTLWVGDLTVVRHVSLTGTLLATVQTPGPKFVDGLEFIAGSC